MAVDEKEHNHAELVVEMIFRGLLPIALLLGGLVLLYIRLPGWSMIFGLPMTVIGTVFLIYSYDDFVSGKISDEHLGLKITNCKNCGKKTPKIVGVLGSSLCNDCRKNATKSEDDG